MPLRLIASLPLLAAAPAAAQIHTFFGLAPNEAAGHDVDFAGDVDGDGIEDVIVGAPWWFFFGCDTGQATGARVYSGATGAVLHELSRPNSDDHHGVVVRGAGDVNADGFDDLLVANGSDFDCYGANDLVVYSGLDASILHVIHVTNWYYYHHDDLDGVGDVDGDGHADFAVGDAVAGELVVYSGRTGAELLHVVEPGTGLGRSVAGVGDWNMDGLPDVAASNTAGNTRVYSVLSGAVLFDTPFPGVVHDAADFDGDGARDLLIADAPSEVTGAVDARVVSGADGAVLRTYDGWTRYQVAGDYDGDGTPEIVAGDPVEVGLRGRAALLSGTSGEILALLETGAATNALVGYSIASGADVDGDGVPDVIVGSPGDRSPQGTQGGAVRVYSGLCRPTPRNYCTAAPNSAGAGAEMGFTGTWSALNNDLVLRAEGLPPHHFGIFFHGQETTALPLGNGIRCVGGAPLVRLEIVNSGAGGAAAVPLDNTDSVHGGTIAPGTTRFFQLWYRDTPAGGSGFNLTDGLSVTFCP